MEEVYCSVGLVGDGDEVAAIEDVEGEFGVALDKRDAALWLTAGDVFASLLKALPSDAATDSAAWERFGRSLCRETGMNPFLFSKNSPLLLPDRGFWAGFGEAWVGYFWCLLAFAILAFLFSRWMSAMGGMPTSC